MFKSAEEDMSLLKLDLPDHILSPLLSTASCANLEQALENHIETAKTADGRLHLASLKILPIVLDLTRCLISSSDHYLLMLSLKLLRNLCAGEMSNQNCFIEGDGVNVVAKAFDSSSSDTSFGDEIIRFGLGLFANVLCLSMESLNKKRNEHQLNVSKEFALSVLEILKRVVGVVDFFTSSQSKLPTGTPAVDVLWYSINILRDICAQDRTEESVTIVDSLLSSGLLDILLDFLRELEPPSTIKKCIPKESTSRQWKVCPYKGFRRDVVAIIANCLYGMKHVQDEVRQKDGILLLLQQCVVDDDNEFLREYGIWAVRNLLEGNEENQKVVADLEIQGSADVPALTELGFRMELDPQTRRAKLVNISPR